TFTRTCTDPRQIIFKDNSIGADVYHWDFGDGSSSAEANPVKEYPVPGKYTVVLTVTNNATGCTQNKTQVIHIIREKADFSTVSNETCKNSSVVFSAPNTNPDNISSYTWKFGDGKSVITKTKSVSHKYTKAGTYDVTLIIKDLHGCIDSIVKPMVMKVNGPTSVFRSDIAGTCLNNTVNFIDSSYSDGEHPITQWQFNWGDGTVQNFNAPPFSHTYSKPGRFSVSLIVTDSKGCTDTLRKPNMIVVSQPIAAFSADTLSCTTQAVKFKNISSGPGLIYNWDFGDGNTSTAKDPVHLYNTEGIYTVSLSINDQYGCSGFVSKTNYVRIANPVADFILSDSVGTCPPLVVNFTNTSVNYSSWSWDFGDGTTSKERNPSHFYSQVGTFTAVLTIQGPGGCVSKKSRTIKVDGPSGTFSYTNMMGCAPLKSTFKASTQKNLSFLWDFNDGTTLTTKDSTVEHTYTTPGKYLPK